MVCCGFFWMCPIWILSDCWICTFVFLRIWGVFKLLFEYCFSSVLLVVCFHNSEDMNLRIFLWSYRFLRLFSFFFFQFPFCCSVVQFPFCCSLLSSSSLIISFDALFCCWTHPPSFLFHVFSFSVSIFPFLKICFVNLPKLFLGWVFLFFHLFQACL